MIHPVGASRAQDAGEYLGRFALLRQLLEQPNQRVG